MEDVKHCGVVEAVSQKMLRVRIEQVSACAGCHAKSICLSADKKDKIVEIENFDGDYRVGEAVEVTGTPQMGWKAIGLAYILPLVLMVAVLVMSIEWWFPQEEAIAAIASIGSLIIYYIGLYLFKDKIKKTLVFQVQHITDDLIQ